MDFVQKINEIILIDDDVINNFYHQMLIKEDIGFSGKINTFTNAEEALLIIKSNPSTEKQLFLVDINMPSMNGFEFVEAYEKLQITEDNSIFCMLTSSLHSRDKELASEHALIKGFFTKPLTKEALISFIHTL